MNMGTPEGKSNICGTSVPERRSCPDFSSRTRTGFARWLMNVTRETPFVR